MKTISQSEIKDILYYHELWLIRNSRGIQANLSNFDLSGFDFTSVASVGKDFSYIDFSKSNLTETNFYKTTISSTDFSESNLSKSNLSYSNLYAVNLNKANLSETNFLVSSITNCDFSDSIVSENTNFSMCDIFNCKNIPKIVEKITNIIPEGDVIGWKKCMDNVLVKLRIPAEARRSNATGRKCRAEFVDVLEVIGGKVGISMWDKLTRYRVGDRVFPNHFDENKFKECSNGIHFFLTRDEAYYY